MLGFIPVKRFEMHDMTFSAFIDELEKVAAGAPTRGNFMMASDLASPLVNSLRAPLIQKFSEMSGVETSFNPGDFKPANLTKKADISPTQPLGNGGGNPHRAQSDLPSIPVNSLRSPLIRKVAEDGGDIGDAALAYYYGGSGGGGRGPVSSGFKQESGQGGASVNSLRAPLIKKSSLVPSSAAAAKNIGKAPQLTGGPGPSIADQVKPSGIGPTLPGANKTTVGGYRGAMQR